jgi:hypothetical protein
MFVGDDYKYRRYCVAWKPEKDIPYWVVDKSIGKVFVVCHNDEENTITEKEMLVQLEKAIKEMKKKLK